MPDGATAVVANITVTNPTTPSYLTAWPAGTPRPLASNLNFTAGQTVPNLVTVPLSATGALDLYNRAGTTDVIVDVTGYYGPGTGPARGWASPPLSPHASVTPGRRRSGGAADQCTGKTPGAGANSETLTVQVTGNGGVPTGATAVVANITVTNPVHSELSDGLSRRHRQAARLQSQFPRRPDRPQPGGRPPVRFRSHRPVQRPGLCRRHRGRHRLLLLLLHRAVRGPTPGPHL